MNKKTLIKKRRAKRNRARIEGSASSPRLSVFRSNRYIHAQLIDDVNGKTLVSMNTIEIEKGSKATKVESAAKMGEMIAKKAIDAGIKKVVFDRGSYKYHGRVKALAEGSRKAGLKI